jgi:hypothetical protein
MSEFWGVPCPTCEEFINLGEQNTEETFSTYLPPLGPVLCSCGSSHLYKSGDVVDEDGVTLNPWPE